MDNNQELQYNYWKARVESKGLNLSLIELLIIVTVIATLAAEFIR